MRVPYKLRSTTITLALPLAIMLVSIQAVGQQSHLVAGIDTKEEPPRSGLRVLEVHQGSLAQDAGLQTMDTISRYGDLQIVDAASYFVARDAAEKSPETKVELVFWRGRERFATSVLPGRLGIEFDEYSAVAYQLNSLIEKLNVLIEVPDYFSEAEIAKGAMPSREKVQEEIRFAIDRAALDGTLTTAQILVAKINAIPDDAPAAEIEKQSQLLKELVSTLPQSFTDYLGYGTFFKHKKYRAAIACFKRSLEADSASVSERLNLGIAYFQLRMFDEADAAVDYVLKEDSALSEYGHAVAFQIKANAALGHRDFANALDYAKKAFDANPTSNYLMSLWQITAAQNGDLKKFYEVVDATSKALPKDYANLRCRTDAIEAYILVKNNQIEKARAIAHKWIGTEKLDSNARYWSQYPSGDDIVKNWKELLGQN